MGILDAPVIPKDSTGRRLDSFKAADTETAAPISGSYIDPRRLPEGKLAAASAGKFVGITGGVDDVFVQGGKLTFRSAADGGSGISTAYVHVETPDGRTVQHIHVDIEFPSTATTTMALIVPGQSWYPGPGTSAGVHAILVSRNGTTATAVVGSGGYPSGLAGITDRNNTLSTPFPGRTVAADLYINANTGRVLIYINGKKELEYTSAAAVAYLSKYGILEWTSTGTPSPVHPKVLSFYATSEFDPPAERGTFRGSGNVATAVTLTGAFADISSGAFAPVVFPLSGQVLVIGQCWVQQDSGKTQLRVSGGGANAGAQTVALGAFNGQVTYMSTLTGTPGKRVNAVLQGLHSDGGTGTIRPVGEVGAISLASIPIEPYTPAVEP